VKDDRIYLQHIRDALSDIASYTNAGRDQFFVARMRQDATLRKLEVIGQAVKNLSEETKSEIPGSGSLACANKGIHDYFGVPGDSVGRRRVRIAKTRAGPIL
jgi:uncharacterized protein with HEPN domain